MVKRERDKVVLKTQWGMAGDAHAGDWHRQVSLLAGESIDTMKKILPTFKNGDFAENIITRGIDLTCLKIGDHLLLGEDVVLEITQIGKECHNQGCAIKKATGDCNSASCPARGCLPGSFRAARPGPKIPLWPTDALPFPRLTLSA
jgi:MOSC domain-containing protein YiiM